jgi:hypothetical protein
LTGGPEVRAPVVPARVFGTFEVRRHHRIPRLRRVAVRPGPPLRFAAQVAELRQRATRVKELYQEVADEIMSAIMRLDPP